MICRAGRSNVNGNAEHETEKFRNHEMANSEVSFTVESFNREQCTFSESRVEKLLQKMLQCTEPFYN
jgi:hypothetical protein